MVVFYPLTIQASANLRHRMQHGEVIAVRFVKICFLMNITHYMLELVYYS